MKKWATSWLLDTIFTVYNLHASCVPVTASSIVLCYVSSNTIHFYCSLSTLKKLSELYIDKNDFSDGLPSVISELESLTVLNVRDCKLTELPSRYCTLYWLYIEHSIYSTCYEYKLSIASTTQLCYCKFERSPKSIE